MTNDNSECGYGKFAGWTVPPVMSHKELIVSTSAQQDSITPGVGNKITVHRIYITCKVSVALTTTVRSSISFGTGGISDLTKILMSNIHTKGDSCNAMWSPSLNVIGAVNEPVTLTNHTFSGGSVITHAVIYYTES
jgi:hypothetical protein